MCKLSKKWVTRYLQAAKTYASFSKDPSTKVGAVIINPKTNETSHGFNGFVKDCNELLIPQDTLERYIHVIHAEQNAISFFNGDFQNSVLICTHSPCPKCLSLVLQKQIKEIHYESFISSWNNVFECKQKHWEKAFLATLEALVSIKRILMANPQVKALNVQGDSYLSEVNELLEHKIPESFLNIKNSTIKEESLSFLQKSLNSSVKIKNSVEESKNKDTLICFIEDISRLIFKFKKNS